MPMIEANSRIHSDGCSCRGCVIVSRLGNLYPERIMALAFLAAGYIPPSPTFDISNAMVMTKKLFGYELLGYWHFFAEDGADKIIESHVRPPSASARTQ